MAVDIKTLAFFSTQVYNNYKAATGVLNVTAVTNYGGFTRLQSSGANDPNTYYCEAWRNEITKEIILVNRGTATLKDATTNAVIASGENAPTVAAAQQFARDIFRLNPEYSITTTGHSKGGYEAQVQNIALTDAAVAAGAPTSQFAALTFAAPAIGSGSNGVRMNSPFETYNGTNVIDYKDVVPQLTVVVGAEAPTATPWRTVVVNAGGLTADPNATTSSCINGAQAAGRIFSQSEKLYEESAFAAGISGYRGLSTLLESCGLASLSNLTTAHSMGNMRNLMSTTGSIGNLTLGELNESYDSGGFRASTVTLLAAKENLPAFKAASAQVIKFIRKVGMGEDGVISPEEQAQLDATNTRLELLLAGDDLSNAVISEVGGSVYVDLGNGTTRIIDAQGRIGQQTVIRHDDGSVNVIETAPDGTSSVGSINTLGEVNVIVTNGAGQTIGTKTIDANGLTTVDTFDPITGENYHTVVNPETGRVEISAHPTNSDGRDYEFLQEENENTLTIKNGQGQIVERVEQDYDQQNNLDQQTRTLYGSDGVVSQTVAAQFFDDGTSLQTTTYPNGRTEVLSTDTSGAPFSRTDTIPGSGNTTTVEEYHYNNAGQPIIASSRRIQTTEDTEGIYRDETVTRYNNGVVTVEQVRYFNGVEYERQPLPAPVRIPSTTEAIGSILGVYQAIRSGQPIPILANGITLLNTFDRLDGNLDFPNLGAIGSVANGANSFYNLYNAFQGNDGFAQVTATLSTVNYFNTTLNATNGLFEVGSSAAGLNSFLNGSNSTANGAFDGLLNNGTPGVLGVLGLINGIRTGDPVSIIQGLGPLLFGPQTFTPWGLAITALTIIFAKEPEAFGVASVTYGQGFDNLRLNVNATGELFGVDRVRDQLNNLIDRSVTIPGGSQVRIGLQAQIDEINTGKPESERIGLIAQRMPGLSWRASDLGNSGYEIVDIDPLTGEQRYPFRRFDDDGVPFSSNPALYTVDLSDPAQRVKLDQALLNSAYNRDAIAPLWEVRTAKLQGDGGQVNAGLSEEERASKAGYAAALDTAYAQANPNPNNAAAKNKRIGAFMPVALDIDGDGQISEASIAQQNQSPTDTIPAVNFNWDNQGFLKNTAWIGANDAFLVLDRDFNQSVDSGTELLSNPLVADPAKGLRSLATWDANGDGKIDQLDPIYRQLKVWQDFNQDGNNTETTVIQSASGPQTRILQDKSSITTNGQTKDRLELNSLADWGITSIDYANNRYEFDSGLRNTGVANGQISYQNIKTVSLEASNQGVSYTPIGAGIRIDDSTGSSTILITQIQSDGGSLPPVNTPPQIDKPIADRTMNEDDVLVWEVPSDAFKDINTNDRLNYTVVQANGQALPAWMDFNPITGQLIAAPAETMNSIALCAIDTPARGLNDAQTTRITWEFREISNHYEFNSGLRRFYAGYMPKTLETQAVNDADWRVAA